MAMRFGSGGGFSSNVGGGGGSRSGGSSNAGESSRYRSSSGANGNDNFARSQKPCIHYQQRGYCNRGDQCHYRHDDGRAGNRGVANNAGSAQEVCRYYQQGKCRYGESCRLRHVDPVEPSWGSSDRGNRGPRGSGGGFTATGRFGSGGGFGESNAFGSSSRVDARQGVSGAFRGSSDGVQFNAGSHAPVPGGFLSTSTSSFPFGTGNGTPAGRRDSNTVLFQPVPGTLVPGGFLSSTSSAGQPDANFGRAARGSAPFGIRTATASIGTTFSVPTVTPLTTGRGTPAVSVPFGDGNGNAARQGHSGPVAQAAPAPAPGHPLGQETWYSEESSLSQDDLKAHEGRNFRLGAIPEDPPPRRFCARV